MSTKKELVGIYRDALALVLAFERDDWRTYDEIAATYSDVADLQCLVRLLAGITQGCLQVLLPRFGGSAESALSSLALNAASLADSDV